MTERHHDDAAFWVTWTAILLGLSALFFVGCAPASEITWQEAVVSWRRLPISGNPVAFGASVASVASQDEAVALLDTVVDRRLPGVRLFIVKYPAVIPEAHIACTSYRDPDQGLIVLSWWDKNGRHDPEPPVIEAAPNLPSGWSVGDASWEVENLIAGGGG